jgi:hypothetical protein
VSELINRAIEKWGRWPTVARDAAAIPVAPTALVKLGYYTGATRLMIKLGMSWFNIRQDYFTDEKLTKLFKQLSLTAIKISQKKNVDLRPSVSAVIMAMKPSALRTVSQKILKDLLDTYVYTKYIPKPTKKSSMCTLCSLANCTRTGGAGGASNAGSHMTTVVKKAMWSINRLLKVEGRGHTLTSVLRKAIDSNLDPKLVTAAKWGARITGPYVITFLGLVTLALYPVLSKRLAALGLMISKSDFQALLFKDIYSLRAFLAQEPDANIEPFLLRVVAAASPVAIVQGTVASSLGNSVPGEFCNFCTSAYGTCLSADR